MRISRKNYETSFFHVMVQGHNKEFIFDKNKNKEKYIKLMKENEKELQLLAYCIMGNHVHMLLYVPKVSNMSKFMHKVNSEYAMYYNYTNEKRIGAVYRDRYKSEAICDERYFFKCINYIHLNPVKANIVTKCENYEYSSYNDYINKVGCANKEILKEIFETQEYMEELKEYSKNTNLFLDIEEYDQMDDTICDYLEMKDKNLVQILEDKSELENLIKHIKSTTKVTYDEIQNRFNITRNKIAKILKE